MQSFPDFTEQIFSKEFCRIVAAVACHVQRHGPGHKDTCFKTAAAIASQLCRFHFPKQPCDDTYWDEVNKRLRIQRRDRWCVGFNDIIAFLLRCNHDIQFLNGNVSEAHTCVFYVTKYLSKNEKPLYELALMAEIGVEKMEKLTDQHLLTAEQKCNKTVSKCYNCISSQQQMPAVFVAHLLLGRSDHYTNAVFEGLSVKQFLAAYSDKQTDKDSEHYVCIPTEKDTYMLCNYRLDYEKRGDSLKHVSVYELKSQFKKQKKLPGKEPVLHTQQPSRGRPRLQRFALNPSHLHATTHEWVKRQTPVIPNLWGNPPAEDEPFFRYVLLLTKPHTGDMVDLQGGHDSWKQAWVAYASDASTSETNKRVGANLHHLRKCNKDATTHKNMRAEDEAYTANHTDTVRKRVRKDVADLDTDMLDAGGIELWLEGDCSSHACADENQSLETVNALMDLSLMGSAKQQLESINTVSLLMSGMVCLPSTAIIQTELEILNSTDNPHDYITTHTTEPRTCSAVSCHLDAADIPRDAVDQWKQRILANKQSGIFYYLNP